MTNKVTSIRSILIANRGEIACRIIKTCRKLGIESIAVFSDSDKNALHVKLADQAVYIGSSDANSSYLNMENIIRAAQKSGADAIHPGYGFLSENAEFAKQVEVAGITFIGPNAEAIEKMGSKSLSKEIAQQHKVPVILGYKGKDQSLETLKAEALKIGFPVLLKAAAGGGGKGMRILENEKGLETAIQSAKSEAKNAFGSDELLIEKYLPHSRHIEIQIFGDKQGNAIYLNERECTIQRRYQKIFEESPSPVLDEKTRKKMGEAAVRMAKALNYDNAGTVEFIYEKENFYFLEVNTRLQVEHPVTEAVTGLDLVEWQILAAEGKPLPLKQEAVKTNGYALECRIYAEDASKDFMPATGKILRWKTPDIDGVRYDTGIESGDEISVYYDPMICKLIAHATDRESAIRKMQYALKHTVCLGTVTNLPFLQHVLKHEDFKNGNYNTHFIAQHIKLNELTKLEKHNIKLALVAAAMYEIKTQLSQKSLLQELPFAWRNNFYKPSQFTFILNDEEYVVDIVTQKNTCSVSCMQEDFKVEFADDKRKLIINDVLHHFELERSGSLYYIHHKDFSQLILEKKNRFPEIETEDAAGGYHSNMPASVVKVMVKKGDKIEKGQSLMVLSSMKMENTIAAFEDGIVEDIFVNEGENIEAGRQLLKINGEG